MAGAAAGLFHAGVVCAVADRLADGGYGVGGTSMDWAGGVFHGVDVDVSFLGSVVGCWRSLVVAFP